jgi:rRNA-processing protein EBP2
MHKSLTFILERSNAPLTTENEEDLFDITLDNEAPKANKKARLTRMDPRDRPAPNAKRQNKNAKYGFGGKKRFAKSGDAKSTNDMRDFPGKKMREGFAGKGGKMAPKKRLGKSRRAKGRV